MYCWTLPLAEILESHIDHFMLYEELFAVDIYLMLFIYCYWLIYFLLPCENKLTFASSILFSLSSCNIISSMSCGLTNLVQNTVISLCHLWKYNTQTRNIIYMTHMCYIARINAWTLMLIWLFKKTDLIEILEQKYFAINTIFSLLLKS